MHTLKTTTSTATVEDMYIIRGSKRPCWDSNLRDKILPCKILTMATQNRRISAIPPKCKVSGVATYSSAIRQKRRRIQSQPEGMTPSQSVQGGILRQIDHFVTSSYPDDDLDFILSAISGTARSRAQDSATPSTATTSRLYCRATQQQPRTRVSDVRGRHWKARRPIGRADTIQHAIQTQTQVMGHRLHLVLETILVR